MHRAEALTKSNHQELLKYLCKGHLEGSGGET
jgi:hypothetical protein